MTADLWWAYGFNIVMNGLLAFATAALLTQLFLWILRIKQPRLKAFCLAVPLFKIGLDLFFYNFSNWALLHRINPFEGEPGTRMITAMVSYPASTASYLPCNTGIHLSLAGGKSFTVADLIVLSVDPLWIKITVISIGGLSLGLCLVRLFQWIKSRQSAFQMVKEASPCGREVKNPLLCEALKKVQILSSAAVEVPCAFPSRKIIFPSALLPQLTQEEFEAILAHELDHLKWRDSYLRLFLHFLCSLFWWLPTKWWIGRIEQAQEFACDLKINKFKIAGADLAQAITKAAQAAKNNNCLPVSCFVQGSGAGRVKALLAPPRRSSAALKILQGLLAASFLIPVLFGQFWIF